jgi:mono/diheme cytochrome c family protein
VLLGFGYVLLQQTSQQYQESTTPPPAVVNRVLPDEISLEQGERLFQTHCAAWETLPDQLTLLKGRLVDARDSEIYAMTQNGWRGLPPCEGDMSEPERWSLVNYLRTLSH